MQTQASSNGRVWFSVIIACAAALLTLKGIGILGVWAITSQFPEPSSDKDFDALMSGFLIIGGAITGLGLVGLYFAYRLLKTQK